IHQPDDLPRMAEATRRMVRDTIDAFLRQDAETALAVLRQDDEVDALRTRLVRELIAAMRADAEAIEAGVALILVVRSLERIADHATNIAEDVVYILRAEVVKHRKASLRAPAPGA
ncbi:MAG: phosphate transport system regulatory protein PhoU, partial [Planctomycetaceae bacterium]|nr:phosphate transport system regulatory protein PhoU [Planctomycetaceae bacterium]